MSKFIKLKIRSEFLNIVIIGFLLTVIGIIFLIQNQYIGILLFMIGLLIISFNKGVLIDLEKKRIKFYKEIAFRIFGKWKECKDIQYIALTRITLSQNINAVTIPGKYTEIKTKLSFITKSNKQISIITGKKSKLLPITRQIADSFNVDIYDNTAGNKVWIKNKIPLND